MVDSSVTAEKLDIGKVIESTFSVVGRNFVSFAVLSLIFAGLPSLLVTWGSLQMSGGNFQLGAFVNTLGGVAVAIISGAILQGSLVKITVADMNGRPHTLADGLAAGLHNILPLIGIGILFALGVGFGFVLLIVPGVILALMWCVAAPAQIAENTGVIAAFGRSRTLTRGNRWRIFVLMILLVILSIIIQTIFGAIFGGLTSLSATAPARLIVEPVAALLNGIFDGAGVAVLYTELRRVKDGVGVHELAALFD